MEWVRTYDRYALKVNLTVLGEIPVSTLTLTVEILGLESGGSRGYIRLRLSVWQQH